MTEFIPWNSKPLEEWRHKYARRTCIEIDGISTHYLVKGSGEPVILIHGFFFDTNMWNKNIDALSETFRVYAIDLWGFGYSDRKSLNYGYELYARQLTKFMDKMGIDEAYLIGQSMGGGTIIKFTISNQHRVKKIILVNSAGMPNKLPITGRISNLPKIGELMYGLNNDFIRKIILGKNFLYNKKLLTNEFFEQLTNFHKIERSSEVMLSITREQFFDTLLSEIKLLGGMEIPILIIWGREEKSIPLEVGQKLHGLLKNSTFEILKNAGHCSNIDQFEQFNQLALIFLS
jgi:pimeloyl-ACP methyl ester carboxylesterase